MTSRLKYRHLYSDAKSIEMTNEFALEHVPTAAREGYLFLAVGAGVSMSISKPRGCKMPSWKDLIQRLEKAISIKSKSRNDLLDRADAIWRETAARGESLHSLVEDALYCDFKEFSDGNWNCDLLSAICALVSKCRERRPVYILNFNYDDTLAYYLQRFGYRVRVLTEFPTIIGADDVVIIHPHGFLPKSSEFEYARNKEIVLASKAFREAQLLASWYHPLVTMLVGKSLSLCFGLSGDDPHALSLLESVWRCTKAKRIMGFIVSSGASRQRQVLEESGILTVSLGGFKELPDFIRSMASRVE